MAEVNGRVNEWLEAFIVISLTNGAEVECLIDTGFDGNLMLPREFVEQNGLRLVGQELFSGVEELEFSAEMALAEVSWLGDEFQLQVIVSDTNSAMLGTHMLVDSKLEIDYLKQTVRITKTV